jgi:hypothetical protein
MRVPQLLALGIGILLLVILSFYGSLSFEQPLPAKQEGGVAWTLTGEDTTRDEPVAQVKENPRTPLVLEDNTSSTEVSAHASKIYTHTNPSFFFKYPEGMAVSMFEESGGETILLQGEGHNESVQIFILPFDEPLARMTPERILEDIPELIIVRPQEAILPNDIRALIFESTTAGVGDTREAWVVHRGYLYQIITPLPFDKELSRIMATWQFTM